MQDSPQLIFLAVGPEGDKQEWPLREGRFRAGREDGSSGPERLSVQGDSRLSRQQFELRVEAGKVRVVRNPSARNPLVFEGQEIDEFPLQPGQIFFAGKTQFSLQLRQGRSQFTLLDQARERSRLRRLEDCFDAVIQLLQRLRQQAGQGAPWRQAFPILGRLLPGVLQVAFVERQGTSLKVLDAQEFVPGNYPLDQELLARAEEARRTTTFAWEEADEESVGTVCARLYWSIASPIQGLENTAYALTARGSGFADTQSLEEVATLLDVVAEMVGHHLIVEQAAEYSSLLGVFGHHVGTLFKTSGALELWSGSQRNSEAGRVVERLLPIWGVSQAIALHKKQGETQWNQLLLNWVQPDRLDEASFGEHLTTALERLVAYFYLLPEEPAFLPWFLNHRPIQGESGFLLSLPPLNDNPRLMDKTLALTLGLVEALNNLRKYPEARGSGREDRRDLNQLPEEMRRVQIIFHPDSSEFTLEIQQPVVLNAQGEVPRSRSLQRIRTLESRLLHGLVETGDLEMLAPTPVEHVVRARQFWTYRWGQLRPR